MAYRAINTRLRLNLPNVTAVVGLIRPRINLYDYDFAFNYRTWLARARTNLRAERTFQRFRKESLRARYLSLCGTESGLRKYARRVTAGRIVVQDAILARETTNGNHPYGAGSRTIPIAASDISGTRSIHLCDVIKR